jgi:hypothetical protein
MGRWIFLVAVVVVVTGAAVLGYRSEGKRRGKAAPDAYNTSRSEWGGNRGGLQVRWRPLGDSLERGKTLEVAVELCNNGVGEEVVRFSGLRLQTSFFGEEEAPEVPDPFSVPVLVGRVQADGKDLVRLQPGDYLGWTHSIAVPADRRAVGLRLAVWYENPQDAEGAWVGRIGLVPPPSLVIGEKVEGPR